MSAAIERRAAAMWAEDTAGLRYAPSWADAPEAVKIEYRRLAKEELEVN